MGCFRAHRPRPAGKKNLPAVPVRCSRSPARPPPLSQLVANPRSSPACASWPARRLTALKRTRCNFGCSDPTQSKSNPVSRTENRKPRASAGFRPARPGRARARRRRRRRVASADFWPGATVAILDDSEENLKHIFIGRLAYGLNLFLPCISVRLKRSFIPDASGLTDHGHAAR